MRRLGRAVAVGVALAVALAWVGVRSAWVALWVGWTTQSGDEVAGWLI
jgi:hypothetical protein